MKVERVLRWPRTVSAPALLNALDEAGYRVRRTGGRERTEVHWDTQDGALRAAGATLVFHVEAGRWALATPQRNVVEAGDADAPPPGGRLAADLAAATGGRPVIPLLTGCVDEEVFKAAFTGAPAVQLALRRWAFTSPLRSGARARCALVTLSGEAAAVQRASGTLQGRTRCRRVDEPFLDLATGALRLSAPGREPPQGLRIRPADTTAEAFAKLLARQGWMIAANAPGVAADLDPEFVHDLRVAARRARGVLRLARLAGVTHAAELSIELSWLAHECGALRDLDVFLAEVAAALAAVETPRGVREAILLTLHGQRDAALTTARVTVASPRLRELLAILRRPPSPVFEGAPGALPVGDAAALLVSAEVRRLARWRRHDAAGLTDGELHRVRIAAKRARYALEFFAPVLPTDTRKVVRGLVRVQDTLGAHQDAAVAVQRLEALAKAMQDSGASLETLLALGGLRHSAMERQNAQRVEFAARAPRLWRRLRALRPRMTAQADPAGTTP